jgi:hypothetical protein
MILSGPLSIYLAKISRFLVFARDSISEGLKNHILAELTFGFENKKDKAK